jgi:tRNA 2-thiocytidine biosynthesis protein TtcA
MPETMLESRERVLYDVGRAMGTFSMLCPGDRVVVGVSGGKDSMCLVHALETHRGRAPFPYELVAVTVEQGKFTADIESIRESLARMGVDWVVRPEPRTLELLAHDVEHGCDVCSRNRRGALYRIAEELGGTALALGHTADDCAESLLRNVLFNGRIASLPPVAESRRGGLRVIRPLVYVTEEWTRRYSEEHGLRTVGCVCHEKEGPRSEIRRFLEDMETKHPGRSKSLTAALGNVNPYTLADPGLRKENADIPVFGRSNGSGWTARAVRARES